MRYKQTEKNRKQCKQLILSISALMPYLGLMRLKIKKGLLPWRYRHHTNTPYHVQRAKTNQPIDYKDHGDPTTHECVTPQTQKHQSTNSKTSTHKLKNINPQTQKTSTHKLKKHQPTNSKNINPQSQKTSTHKLKKHQPTKSKLINSKTHKLKKTSTHQLKSSKTKLLFLFYNNTLIFAPF